MINLCPWEAASQRAVGNEWEILYFPIEVKKKKKTQTLQPGKEVNELLLGFMLRMIIPFL